jgi:Phospholipase C
VRGIPAVAALVMSTLLVAGCTASVRPTARPTVGPTTATSTSTPASTPTAGSKALQHVVIIMEENKPAATILGNAAAPYLNGLARTFASATDYSGIGHPSLPNYLALTTGTTAGITTDCNPPGGSCVAAVRNVGDEIVASGRSWRFYAESMPAPCSADNSGRYAVKHNPFMYYPDVTGNAAHCDSHDVPYGRFGPDLATTASLPSYSFVSPDLCDDMHDCSIATGDAWLAHNVPRILESPAFTTQRSLLVITFDEGDSGSNVVSCIFAGPAARRGYTSAKPYNHYSLLRTVEAQWGLPPLAAGDAAAVPMNDMLSPDG